MRPYFYSLNEYLQEVFSRKIYKLSLNGGMTCPNRDGHIDTRGCIFCSAGGSGEFAPAFKDIHTQIEEAKALLKGKYTGSYIAYFQNFTNTYGSVDYLRDIFTQAISHPDVVGLAIGTRPDCLGDDIIDLLAQLSTQTHLWVELGLQTIHEDTATYIRRGYTLKVYDESVRRLTEAGIHIVTHLILGLPGETTDMMIESAGYVGDSPVKGIKLQLLHVLEHTDLAQEYRENPFKILSMEEYFHILGAILPILPPDMVIHRLTGDGPKRILIEPQWSANKKHVLNSMNRFFQDNNIIQGSRYQAARRFL